MLRILKPLLLIFIILPTQVSFAQEDPPIFLHRPAIKNFKHKIKLSFSWDDPQSNSNYYFFTIATDRAFKHPVYRKKIQDTKAIFSLDPYLIEGDPYYYIRVTAADGKSHSNTQGVQIHGSGKKEVEKKNTRLFYSAHRGIWDDELSGGPSLSQNQNSILRIGMGKNIKANYLSLDLEAAVAYITEMEVANADYNLSPALELELSSMFNYQGPKSSWIYSLGPSFERFSTFSTEDYILNDKKQVLYLQRMYFFNLAISYGFNLFSRELRARLLIARSFQNDAKKIGEDRQGFSAYKYSLSGEYELLWDFYALGFAQYYYLWGPSDLLIRKFGAGIGLRF